MTSNSIQNPDRGLLQNISNHIHNRDGSFFHTEAAIERTELASGPQGGPGEDLRLASRLELGCLPA